MADTEQPVEQQVTSKMPEMKQKNPKRVAAGKAIAERTKSAREAQKKALTEAQSYIAQLKNSDAPSPPAAPAPPAPPAETTKNVLTTTQLLSIASIFVSLLGLYYKREEIKNAFTKKADPPLPRAPPPVDAASKRNIRQMD